MGKFTQLLRATGLAVSVAMPAIAQDADTVIVTVNGTEITLGHVVALQERLPEQYRQLEDEVLFNGIIEQLIQQTTLAQEMEKNPSDKLAIQQENETRAFLAGQLLEKVGTAEISEEDIQAAYAAQYASGEPEQEFNASHILVETQQEAMNLIEEISAGADFAEMARAHSTGPSGPNGGELGWFGRGAMVPAFEEAVVSLEDGDVTDAPVETQFGWHIVKRNESRVKAAPGLEQVRAEIENALRSQALEAEIQRLTDTATIERADVEIDPAIIRNVDIFK